VSPLASLNRSLTFGLSTLSSDGPCDRGSPHCHFDLRGRIPTVAWTIEAARLRGKSLTDG
jgi:hypothetical protein